LLNWTRTIILVSAGALLLGCSDRQTDKATPDRLAILLTQGPDGERLTQASERLETALNRENATGSLSDNFDTDGGGGSGVQSLNTLFALALERNPDVGQAAQAINRADVARMNAIYGYLPQISASVTYSELNQEIVQTDNEVFDQGTANYPVTNLAVELSQPIFNLSRIFNIQLQNTARTVAEVEYIAAVQRVTYETFDTYVTAAQSRAKITSLRQRMSLISRQVASESALTDIGLGTDTLRNSYAAERASLASDEAIEATRLASALADLAFLTGTTVTDVERISLPQAILRSERNTSIDAGIAAAQDANPALLATAIGVVETELSRKQAIAADFAPVLEAFARYEDETREGSRFGGGSQTVDTTVGVRLTIPIFNASGQGYQSGLQSIDLRSAALEYYAIRRQLRSQITSTYQRMTELSTAISQSSTAVARAANNVSIERDRVASGESAELAVFSRQLTESAARETLEFQRLEYFKAWGRYQYLTGASLSVPGL
jgi:outer membrane protein TolC